MKTAATLQYAAGQSVGKRFVDFTFEAIKTITEILRVSTFPRFNQGARIVALVLLAVLGAAGHAPSRAADAAPTGVTPTKRVADAPKSTLANPYNPSNIEVVNQGHELFQSYSCSGCHGGTGGGGMCPPINGDVWFYGLSDDALFRLVTLGSVEMMKSGGYDRLGAAGLPMPPFGSVIKSDDDLWKIITWIRSIYKGDPKNKTW